MAEGASTPYGTKTDLVWQLCPGSALSSPPLDSQGFEVGISWVFEITTVCNHGRLVIVSPNRVRLKLV